MSSVFEVGEKFMIPHDKNYQDDVFIVSRARPFANTQILDGVCEGDPTIMISVHADQVEKTQW